MDKPNRSNWSRINMPFELVDLLTMIGKNKGYKKDQMHLFLYHLVKAQYPAEVERLADFLDARWMDVPPEE